MVTFAPRRHGPGWQHERSGNSAVRGGQMRRILQTRHFGPHRVDVVEQDDNEGASYVVVVDDAVVTDPPLEAPPNAEDVVRIYARSTGQA